MRREYDELRVDMIQELGTVEARMTQPALTAKSYLDPMKKAIKKRNEKKVRLPSLSCVVLWLIGAFSVGL